jgi:hypothetical protein
MKQKIIIIIGVALGLFFSVGGYFISSSHHKWVQSCPQVYVYQDYLGPANPVLAITDLDDKEQLVKRYDVFSKGKIPDFGIAFPLINLAPRRYVYLLGYTEDSVLADIVTYTYNRNQYLRCWVDARTIHKHPPKLKK